ncbi:MAG: DedA family protein [Candidatus Methylumidiphilus sp.]
MSLQDWIVQYGYLALFIGTFLEGETILIVAGYLAQDGYLDLPLVILSAFLGTFAGDQSFFFIGRFQGMRFLDRHPAWQGRAVTAFALLHRHQIAVILGFRFLYGIRNVTPLAIGSSGFNPLRFFVLNFVGALAWAIAFGSFGYHLGAFAEALLDDVEHYERIALGFLLALALAYYCWRTLRKLWPPS